MAEKLDSKEMVTPEELIYLNMMQIQEGFIVYAENIDNRKFFI